MLRLASRRLSFAWYRPSTDASPHRLSDTRWSARDTSVTHPSPIIFLPWPLSASQVANGFIHTNPNFPRSQATFSAAVWAIPQLLRKSSPALSAYAHRRQSGDRVEASEPLVLRFTEFGALGRNFFLPQRCLSAQSEPPNKVCKPSREGANSDRVLGCLADPDYPGSATFSANANFSPGRVCCSAWRVIHGIEMGWAGLPKG